MKTLITYLSFLTIFLFGGINFLIAQSSEREEEIQFRDQDYETEADGEEGYFWDKAKREDTEEAYQNYLYEYNNGNYKNKAQEKRDEIRNNDTEAVGYLNADLEKSGDNINLKVQAYQKYLNRTPQKYYTRKRQEATQQIALLREALTALSVNVKRTANAGELITIVKNPVIKKLKDFTASIKESVEGKLVAIPKENYTVTRKKIEGGFQITYKGLQANPHQIVVSHNDVKQTVDATPKNYDKNGVIISNNKLQIIGNNPPFSIQISEKGRMFAPKSLIGKEGQRVFKLSEIYDFKGGKEYTVKILSNNTSFGEEATFVYDESSRESSNNTYIYILGGICILLLFLLIFKKQIYQKLYDITSIRIALNLSPPNDY
jgi:hypothetical protein